MVTRNQQQEEQLKSQNLHVQIISSVQLSNNHIPRPFKTETTVIWQKGIALPSGPGQNYFTKMEQQTEFSKDVRGLNEVTWIRMWSHGLKVSGSYLVV